MDVQTNKKLIVIRFNQLSKDQSRHLHQLAIEQGGRRLSAQQIKRNNYQFEGHDISSQSCHIGLSTGALRIYELPSDSARFYFNKGFSEAGLWDQVVRRSDTELKQSEVKSNSKFRLAAVCQ